MPEEEKKPTVFVLPNPEQIQAPNQDKEGRDPRGVYRQKQGMAKRAYSKAAQKAFGETYTSPELLEAARRISEGTNPEVAIADARPQIAANELKHAAELFMKHPQTRFLVEAYRQGVLDIARNAAPLALQRQTELMQGKHGASASVQSKAADSILDRGGLPRSTLVHTDVRADQLKAIEAFLVEDDDDDEEGRTGAAALPPAPGDLDRGGGEGAADTGGDRQGEAGAVEGDGD